MNLRELQREKEMLLKELRGYKSVLNSPVLNLSDSQRQLYMDKAESCQIEINNIDKQLLKKRKRWR